VGKGEETHKGISFEQGITLHRLASEDGGNSGSRGGGNFGGRSSGRQGGVFGGGSSGETQGTGGTESTATGPEEVVLGAVVIDGLEETSNPSLRDLF